MSDKLTIVGPEPDDTGFKTPLNRVNIESLMLMAKYDADFKRSLLKNREAALKESAIDFTHAEKIILSKISNEKLLKNIDEFYIPGINEKSLSNWKMAASVILLITSIMLTGFHCSTDGNIRGATTKSFSYNLGTWTDDNTFTVTAVGVPKRTLTDIEERKTSSKRAASLNAQYQMIERFRSVRLFGATGAEPDNVNYLVGKEVVKAVKKGTIINVRWDKDQNCEIDFQVKDKGLKKKIQVALFRRPYF